MGFGYRALVFVSGNVDRRPKTNPSLKAWKQHPDDNPNITRLEEA